ncbi:hypothetical protein [Nocardioides sp.]|uniref:hypothetical protein n=1 Tax=Nocardioides sp. TaxID=35761 RepID=UPI00261BF4EC|nr:hypothetical protein [Nocardioides sp.]MCW2738258.1 hypothetical protein [Nocardioides sp.]
MAHLADANLSTTRRTLVRGAAWSVPVVAVAATAPAFAASPCDVRAYTLDWDGGNATMGTTAWSRSSYQLGRATVSAPATSGAGSILVTFASAWINESGWQARDRRDQDMNLTISTETNVGGLNQGRGLYVRHESPIDDGRSRRQRLTVSFERAVTGLNFTITDIDSTAGGYWDRVELSATGPGGVAAYTPTRAVGITGTGGTNTNAFRQTDDDTTYNPNLGGGNVGISFANTVSVSTLTLEFWNASGDGQQAIYLSNFEFNAKGC